MVLDPAVRDYYRENPLMVSSPFGGVDGIHDALLAGVLAALDIDVARKGILDVGCGRGYARDFVIANGGTYTGVDIVATRPGFALTLAEATHLPFPADSFDGVFCIDAFEHMPDGEAAAAECYRVLRPGGFVFLSVPNYTNVAGLVKWACETLGGYEKNTWAPFRHWQAQELELPMSARRVRRAFGKAGFSNMHRIGYGAEVDLGLFPWIAHAHMPEAILFRLQRSFARLGPAVVKLWPGASLHGFWKMEKE